MVGWSRRGNVVTETPTTTTMMSWSSFVNSRRIVAVFAVVGLLSCSHRIPVANGEIRRFQGKIEASPKFVHYSEGFLITPGYVDISGLRFTTLERQEPTTPSHAHDHAHHDDTNEDDETAVDDDADDDDFEGERGDDDFDDDDDDTDDDVSEGDDVETTSHHGSGVEGDHDDGGGRRLAAQNYNVEVVLFHEPKNCTKDSNNLCDWSELGVGATDNAGDLRWCCWEDAVDLGLCKGANDEYGKLIVDKQRFSGVYRSLPIPPNDSGEKELQFKFGSLPVRSEAGKYVMVMSNCNPLGRNLTVTGRYVWMSEHGYLPGDLFGEMYFNMAMAVLYMALFFWYLLMMKLHKDSAIPIQNYILLTVGIGFFEVFFKAGDYWVWNEDGVRFWFAMYTGLCAGVLKRAVSRCLVVMVALGWGVVRDDLRDHMRRIYTMGVLYTVASLSCDVLRVLRVVENEVVGPEVERELVDAAAVLTFVVAAVDVTFYMWILDSLSGTMRYLETMSQVTKLQRYLRLRLVLLLSILFAVVWAVFGIVNNFMAASMLEQRHEWGVQAAWEVNYFLVLTAVSFLWKPDPTAKEYAFVMELPSMPKEDLDFATNADVDDDDDDDDVNGDLDLEEEDDEDRVNPSLKIEDGVDA